MTVRIIANPTHRAETRGEGIVLRFAVYGSRFGPVEVELDTGEALALVEEIECAVEAADVLAATPKSEFGI